MKFFNQFLKKSKATKLGAAEKKPYLNKEIGDSGTSIFEGVITQEYNSKLRGEAGIDIYDEMRKSDATVRASVLVCTLPVRSANWYIEPADEDKQNKDVAEFVEYNLKEGMSITWDDFLRQALLMLPFGVMLFEKVFKSIIYKGKEMVALQKLAPRLPKSVSSWQTLEKGDGITWNRIDGNQVSIPIEKLVIFVNEKEGDNWWGTSILRASYKHWYLKNNFYKMDAVSFERQGMGIPYAKMNEGSTPDDEIVIEKILRNLRTHEKAYAVIPDGIEIGFMDMKANTTKSSKDLIDHHNREIVLAVLAQFLELGSSAVGSKALSEDQSSTFYLALEATAKQICDIINNYVIPQLVDLNYTVENYPKLRYSKIGTTDANIMSVAIQRLLQSGAIVADDKLEKHLREILNLPEKEETEEEEVSEVKEEPEEEELKKKASELKFQEPFKSWRALTMTEKKVHFKSLEENMDKFQNEFETKTIAILKKSKSKYLKEFETALNKKDKVALRKIALKYKGEYHTEIVVLLKKVYDFAKTNVAKEMGVTAPLTPKSAVDRMALQADLIVSKHSDEIVYASKKAAVENLTKGKSYHQTMASIELAVDSAIIKMVRNTNSIVIGGSINQGRRLVQTKYENLIYALQRSELLDRKTCNFCLSMDGRIFDKRDPFTKNDIFHSNCRGIWIEVLKEETDKPKITGAPKSLTDRFDGEINELIQPKKVIVKKTSAAAEYLGT